jgi:hypothetical protein
VHWRFQCNLFFEQSEFCEKNMKNKGLWGEEYGNIMEEVNLLRVHCEPLWNYRNETPLYHQMLIQK